MIKYRACQARTGRPVLVGQSDPLFVPTSSLMKTPTHFTDDPAQEDQMQKYQERVDKLSQPHLTRKVGFEEIPKLGLYWKSQTVTCKVNMDWKLELNL